MIFLLANTSSLIPIQLNNLSGRHGDVVLYFNGWSEGFGDAWQYQMQTTSDNMALDDDLYSALNENYKKLWGDFTPTGTAAINYSLSKKKEAKKKKALV